MPSKKFLLIQIREDPVVRIEERASFAKFLKINLSCIDVLNVFDTPNFNLEVALEYDAVLVGGASEASVLDEEKYSFVKTGKSLLNFCVKHSVPVFASCFGFQLAILAFGGIITRNTKDFEIGTIPILQTKEALKDPLFKNISPTFFAVAVHQESAQSLPNGCELLAYTDYCIHAFRVKNKPFWAFQFHPELDKKTLSKRLDIYKNKYTDDQQHFQNVIDSLVETDQSNLLLNNFMNYLNRSS